MTTKRVPHGVEPTDNNGGRTDKSGMKIKFKRDTVVTGLRTYSSVNATYAYIQTAYASGILATATITNNVADFGEVELDAETEYYFLVDNDGDGYTEYVSPHVAGTLPITVDRTEFTGGVVHTGAAITTRTVSVTEVTIRTDEGSAKSGEKWLKTDYPITSGLQAQTQKQEGRESNLVAEEGSTILSKEYEGL